jgi:hypothetical protein
MPLASAYEHAETIAIDCQHMQCLVPQTVRALSIKALQLRRQSCRAPLQRFHQLVALTRRAAQLVVSTDRIPLKTIDAGMPAASKIAENKQGRRRPRCSIIV